MTAEYVDKNCLTFWFPILQAAGLPVPETHIIKTPGRWGELTDGLDDGKPPAYFDDLCRSIGEAAAKVGYPAFLRTGQGSGKHDWKNTCFLPDAESIPKHVCALVEWSAMVDFMGLSCEFWCVRRMLPVEPVCVLPRYGDMPLVKEVRVFVKGGEVICGHPYWPADAIRAGMAWQPHNSDNRREMSRQAFELSDGTISPLPWLWIATKAAAVFKDHGDFSVDLLATRDGWFVTDCALAARSFHYPGCPKERLFQ